METIPEEMQCRDYHAMLITRHQAAQLGMPGMEPWPPDRAARLMAIFLTFGNNEGFTLSEKFQIDSRYIQDVYHLHGSEQPDPTFALHLREWASIYDLVRERSEPVFTAAASWIKQMYNFHLYV